MITVDTADGFQIETNTGTEEAIRANLDVVPAKSTHEESELGQSGELGRDGATPGEAGDGSTETTEGAEPGDRPAVSERRAKPRENLQARLSQLTEQRKAEQERADRLEQELTALRSQQAKPVSSPEPATVAPGKPEFKRIDYPAHLKTYESFIDVFPDAQYEDYTDARAEHRFARIQSPDVSSVVQQELARVTKDTQHHERARLAAEKYPDYQQALNAADQAMAAAGVSLSAPVIEAIKSSTLGGDVLHYLGTHPDECVQLAKETTGLPVEAASLIRSLLEARLSAGVTPGAALLTRTSSAKPPIKPVGSSPVVAPIEESDDEPFENYFRRTNAKDRKAGRL